MIVLMTSGPLLWMIGGTIYAYVVVFLSKSGSSILLDNQFYAKKVFYSPHIYLQQIPCNRFLRLSRFHQCLKALVLSLVAFFLHDVPDALCGSLFVDSLNDYHSYCD